MPINFDLVERVLANIEREPHRWNQNSWVNFANPGDSSQQELCNTTMCFAGHALLSADKGYEVVLSEYKGTYGQQPYLIPEFADASGAVVSAPVAAQDELGFSDDLASDIFYFTDEEDFPNFKARVWEAIARNVASDLRISERRLKDSLAREVDRLAAELNEREFTNWCTNAEAPF